MTYKYYSRMRPVGIGTFPGKPEKITNYPEGRKTVTAGDGTQIQAWGELIYAEPLTEDEIRRYELRGEYEYTPYKHVGYWMNDGVHEIVGINKKYYVLDVWGGEKYTNCFECLTKTKMAEPDVKYTLTPVYYHETAQGIALMNSMADLEEDSPEWDAGIKKLYQIISYKVEKN